MVDPFSVAANAAGIVSLGLSVVRCLVEYYNAYRGQDIETKRTNGKLKGLLVILQSLQKALTERKFTSGEESLKRSIEDSIESCEEYIQELQEEFQKFDKASGKGVAASLNNVRNRVTYPFRQSTLKKLDEDVGEIRSNLYLALSALQIENDNNTRDDLADVKAVVDLVRTHQTSSSAQSWLQAPDATVNHNTACATRHSQSGLWLVKGSKYNEWLQKSNSFLWLNGLPGCGKSILCSTAIQYAFRHRRSDRGIGIAFFYFTFNDASKQSASAMLRALIVQLSSQLDRCEDLDHLHSRYIFGSPPDLALMECLQRVVEKFRETYIFIDAIDECPRLRPREHLLVIIKDICNWRNNALHLLVTSRDEVDIRDVVETLMPVEVYMDSKEVDKDIEKFIASELEKRPSLRRWSKYFVEIREALTEKANGVFRWVECQLQSLESCPKSKVALDRALSSLPKSLDETYERILLSIDGDIEREYARRILTFLCYSVIPMTLKQLMEATGIELGDSPRFNRELRLEDEKEVLSLCPGLIYTTTEYHVWSQELVEEVHISHFSVQEYLESDRIRRQKAVIFCMQREAAHEELAQLCLIYLLDCIFPNRLRGEEDPEHLRLGSYAQLCWLDHYGHCPDTQPLTRRLVEQFLVSQEVGEQSCWTRLKKIES